MRPLSESPQEGGGGSAPGLTIEMQETPKMEIWNSPSILTLQYLPDELPSVEHVQRVKMFVDCTAALFSFVTGTTTL